MQYTSFSCCYMLLYYFIAVLALLDMSDVMHILMCGDLRLFFYDVWWLTLQWHVVFRHIGFIPTDFSVKNFHINYFDLNCQSDFNPSSCAAILMTFLYIAIGWFCETGFCFTTEWNILVWEVETLQLHQQWHLELPQASLLPDMCNFQTFLLITMSCLNCCYSFILLWYLDFSTSTCTKQSGGCHIPVLTMVL